MPAPRSIIRVLVFTAIVACGGPTPSQPGSFPGGGGGLGGGGGGGGGGLGASVDVLDNHYSPQTVTISAGQAVTWTWGGINAHSVTDDNGAYSTTVQATGNFAHVFPTAGTFNYHCAVHGAAGMTGTVVVQ